MRALVPVRRAYELAERERKFLLAEIRAHLKRLSKLSPYLVVIVMPGGFAVLPLLAWWLDRRRNRDRVPA